MALLDRLYELPRENGKITIGGVDIREMDLAYLRKNTGIVLQEPSSSPRPFGRALPTAPLGRTWNLCATLPGWR